MPDDYRWGGGEEGEIAPRPPSSSLTPPPPTVAVDEHPVLGRGPGGAGGPVRRAGDAGGAGGHGRGVSGGRKGPHPTPGPVGGGVLKGWQQPV